MGQKHMSFSEAVKIEALTRSGRRCCICHKHCGLKIELHHIIHKSEGGDDSLDNCIPLCLECHADMRSYDHKHPKGTKFTPKEIKIHRDQWYEKFGKPVFENYDERSLKVDIELYLQIRVELNPSTLAYLAESGGPTYSRAMAQKVFQFADKLRSADDEFIDPELESLRAGLISSVMELAEFMSINTFRSRFNADVIEVPEEWRDRNHEKFYAVREKITEFSLASFKSYNEFTRVALRKLKVRIQEHCVT
jgi:hypothetical protein